MELSCRGVTTEHTRIHIGKEAGQGIDTLLDRHIRPGRSVFLLTDTHTEHYCLPLFSSSRIMGNAIHLNVAPGESSKSLEVAGMLWESMLRPGAGRDALLINLGGGVVSDLGGFLAAGFKRGIGYINIPTTLIGMVDAAVGGKTALNLGGVKNQIGMFHLPEAVYIFPGLLSSLPSRELRSGIAEIAKTALAGDALLWNRLRKTGVETMLQTPFTGKRWQEWILGAVRVKNRLVRQDYREKKIRKSLNFGHTVGHALEAISRADDVPWLHGEAVAAGMAVESALSMIRAGLSKEAAAQIRSFLRDLIPPFLPDQGAMEELIRLMTLDKKNRGSGIFFTLIREPGRPVINVSCCREEIAEALLHGFTDSQ